MTVKERELILSFALGKISESEFFASFGHDFRAPQYAIELLEKARQERSPDDVELSLILICTFGYLPNTLHILNQLLIEGWHRKHEDIALYLEELHDPSSVEPLYQAALSEHEYLDYDEFYELARKCTMGLIKNRHAGSVRAAP
ncbi:MAG TPA: hypothetical protein VFT66_14950 [Roseiflexaceae bacterium]|nr:hypothetical protein [Roseiflexaceae bacterium]